MSRYTFLTIVALAGLTLTRSSAEIPRPVDAPKPLTPEESAAAFRLPQGFRMEIVASEPLISSSSGVCWDAEGRMFVSELHGYNLAGQLDIEELNKTGQLDTQVRRVQADSKFKQAAEKGTFGAVKRLHDSDGDGRMDKADTWAADLPPVYGLVAARGGIIVACAPHIIFLADRDGDGKAEFRETLFTGFGTGELERGINAPQWGVDGWIYFGRGWDGGPITGPHLPKPVTLHGSNFRIRADGSAIEPVTGQSHTFGFAIAENGDHMTVTTTTSYFVAPLPWRYLMRNPNAATGDLQLAVGDRHAYSISIPHPWRQKRADDPAYSAYYRNRYGAAESEASGWFTAGCGPLLYQDRALPGLHGHYFVCEPSGNLIHRSIVELDGSAVALRRAPGEEKSEFAATTDQWSHPMNLLHGPDGAIWVVDYYREIIEDYSAIPRHLQQQYGLYAGHDRGRIYRLTHRDMPAAPSAAMGQLDAPALVRECASPLLWRRLTAQRLLVERGEKSTAPALRELLGKSQADSAAVITALRTLDLLGVATPDDVRPQLRNSAPSVRVHALQVGDRWFGADEGRAMLKDALAAAADEVDARVLVQFALSLGEARNDRAFEVLAGLARERLPIRWMNTAILSSVSGRSADLLGALAADSDNPSSLVISLAQSIAARRDEAELARTFQLLATAKPAFQTAVLNALAKGRKNASRKPLADAAARKALATLAASTSPDVRNATRSLEDTFVAAAADIPAVLPPEISKPAMEVNEETFRKYVAALAGPRDTARGHEVFQQTCMVCHRVGDEGTHFGPDLMGELGVAEETLVRHILLPNERIRPGYETTMFETQGGAPIIGLLKDDGATSVTVITPGGDEQVLLRKDIAGVRRLPISLMPSFGAALQPADLASLLTWLRSNLKADATKRAVLFDEEPGFADILDREAGTAKVVAEGASSGRFCLRVTPPQRACAKIPNWNYRIVESPAAPNEFRYLRLTWRTSGQGVMIELASSGKWPKADEADGRYFAGQNTTKWHARETSPRAPREWDTVTVDLWKDMGSFTLTGLAPTAMGGDAWFDHVELLREAGDSRSDK